MSQRQNKNGYSLVELIVVVAIIGIMTGVLLVSLNNGRNQRAVDAVVRQVAATMRMAQGYAVAGRYQNDGRLPCTFQFFSDAGSGTYGVRYTYHIGANPCAATPEPVVSYSTANGTTISSSAVTFAVPQGTASVAARVTVSKGNAARAVCVDGFGRIREGC